MADNERVTYILEAVDGVTPVTEKVAAGQREVAVSAQQAQAAVDSSSISFIKQLAAASALRHGISGITNGLDTLGMISDDTAASLRKVSAATGVVVGGFQMMKAITPIIEGLRTAELGLAAVETFRSVLNNPAAIALVGVAAGAALGVGAMMLTNNNSNQTTVNQTVVFSSGESSDQRSTARATFEAMGGF